MKRSTPHLLTLALGLAACAPNTAETGDIVVTDSDGESETDTGDAPETGYPTLTGPCLLDPKAPQRLVVTTTDFATGAVSVIDTATGSVSANVALGSVDALPFVRGEYVYLVHRFMIDALDVLDAGDTWGTLSQQAIETELAASANAHRLAFAEDDRAYLTLFGAPEIYAYSLADPTRPQRLPEETIDITPAADADGNPEASLAVVCGDHLFVSIGLLDEDALYAPTTDHDELLIIDRRTGALHDLDPGEDGVQSLPLLGRWARQWRLDPAAEDDTTLLVLTTGIERAALATGEVTWAVTPEQFASAGITDVMQPQAFALSEDGTIAYVAAYAAGFSSVSLYAIGLDGGVPEAPVQLRAGLSSVERVLERVGDELWYGDTTNGSIGVQALDLTADPPTPRFDPLLDVGLPPYSMIAIP